MTADAIFVTLSTFAEYDSVPVDLLKRSGVQFSVNQTGRRMAPAEIIERGRSTTVLIAGVEPYDAATLDQLPNLRCISRCGAGTDSIDLAAARDRGVAVLNTPDIPTQAVAELCLAMMLALSRNLLEQSALMHRRNWTRLEAHLLAGKRVGIVGLGRIGRRVAQLLAPFDVALYASDPIADPNWAKEHAISLLSLPDLIAHCDIVSLHAAHSAEHPLIIGRSDLARMRRGACLVNVARGGMVDEEALCDALESGHLAGAGLDVYSEEPYAGCLCDQDRAILTPHAATLTVETRAAMETECVEKAVRFLRGEIRAEERVR